MQTKDKWDIVHSTAEESQEGFEKIVFPRLYKQIVEYYHEKHRMFVEIGCGSAFLGEAMINKGWNLIGIDFSNVALTKVYDRISQTHYGKFTLVNGDLDSMHLPKDSSSIIYGGGVLEHLKNPQHIINESYKALVPGGILFNAVPFFNIGNALYRMQWGGIPNIPILKQLSEFIHLKLLKGKHMTFGYELQFTRKQLIKMYQKAGFKTIIVGRFDVYVQMNSIKNKWLKEKLIWLSENNPQFWAMIKVIGIKSY